MTQVRDAVAAAHRREWGVVIAATVRVTHDLDRAQECVQDAYAQALRTWPTTGIPDRPGAWLTTVARNRARDLQQRDARFRRAIPELVMENVAPEIGLDRPAIDDDLLRLIFTCCHPALHRDAQVALTLRLICGLSTAEVARAFLVPETTMAARITRAKKKIARARIPYRVPNRAELSGRVAGVIEVVHLIFATGHAPPSGSDLLRSDLLDRALELARLLHRLLPGERDVAALLALLLLTDARRDTRLSGGDLVLLADQDRSRWDAAMTAEGVELLTTTLGRGPAGRYAIQAAIAAVHTESPSWEQTDWAEIVGLYDLLHQRWPNPVVDLNRAVAIGFRDGPTAGLAEIDRLLEEPGLATYGYLTAARADLLRRLGRPDEARSAYDEALTLTDNSVERAFLTRRRDTLGE